MSTLLYSIFPAEVVYSESSPAEAPVHASFESSLLLAAQGPFVEVEFGGARLIVVRTADGGARVVRLISTDPRDYLDPRFSPGEDIKL